MEVFETIIHNRLTKIKFKESITSLKLIKKKKNQACLQYPYFNT